MRKFNDSLNQVGVRKNGAICKPAPFNFPELNLYCPNGESGASLSLAAWL